MQEHQSCIGCGSSDISEFYSLRDVPVSIGSLWNTRSEAIHCTKGDITLAFCGNCGVISNTSYNPDLLDYHQAYDNSLDGSEVFQQFARSLAQRLVNDYHLEGKKIIEIGSGNGRFLSLLCELGDNYGVGFDPSCDPATDTSQQSPRVRLVPKVYQGQDIEQCDFICCRQVLEHIQTPRDFLGALRRSLGSQWDTGLYFEVPNMMHTLRGSSIWTIVYEHCGYYCDAALAGLFETTGFDVRTVREDYDAQFLGIEVYPDRTTPRYITKPSKKTPAQTFAALANGVQPMNPQEFSQSCTEVHDGNSLVSPRVVSTRDQSAIKRIGEFAVAFQLRWNEKCRSLHSRLLRARDLSEPVIVWGAGARAVSLLNSLEDAALVRLVVDINPNKHGKFLGGTGHDIVSPNALRSIDPAVTIVMNEIYANEISSTMQELGIQSEFIIA